MEKPSSIMEQLDHIEKFTGDNFSPDKFVNETLLGQPFSFSSKTQRLADLKQISQNTTNLYKQSSEKFVDILLGNYETFINIGKYVDRIDKNISSAMNTQKVYSNLIQSLRKDVEEFSFGYSKYLKDTSESAFQHNNSKEGEVYLFEPVNDIEYIEQNFNIEEFLNPKHGGKKWLEEQSEHLRVLIDEKKFDECVSLVLDLRKCDLGCVDYDTRLELDNTYNYLIEKLTLSIGRCSSSKEVKFYLEKMKVLGCSGLAVDTFLNWLSKKLKNKIQKRLSLDDYTLFLKTDSKGTPSLSKANKQPSSSSNSNKDQSLKVISEEDNENEEDIANRDKGNADAVNNNNEGISHLHMDVRIIKIITDYFDSLEKSLKVMDSYFSLSSNVAYSTYLIPWLKQEILAMNKQLESLFSKVRSISELKAIMDYITDLFTKLNSKGMSAKFIFDMYFINNLKITLEAIINYCMKSDPTGVSFDLKRYEIVHNDRRLIINCVAEMGIGIYNVSMIISEFITSFIAIKPKFIGIVFLEEFLFNSILAKEFLSFLKNKITKNMSNNYDVKPFGDTNESMASSNQILINYGISIISIEKLFDFFSTQMEPQGDISDASKDSIAYMKQQMTEMKEVYFANLLKVKIESHFFRFFENSKSLLANDITEPFKEPEHAFVIFFQLIKNLAKMVKNRLVNDSNSNDYVKYFVLDNQFANFLKIIGSLKQLNEVYDTEFNMSKVGVLGMEAIVYGVAFIYFAINKILQFDEEGEYKLTLDSFVDSFIKDIGKSRNIAIEQYLKNKQRYYDCVLKYINENRIELLKGY